MDVHDCSKIGYDRILKPGVVITIEPGIYIPHNYDCAQRYQGTGIRIEDDVLITESGYEVLTGLLPKEINHLETLLNNHSYGAVVTEYHFCFQFVSPTTSFEAVVYTLASIGACT